jgi:hypothetical protein
MAHPEVRFQTVLNNRESLWGWHTPSGRNNRVIFSFSERPRNSVRPLGLAAVLGIVSLLSGCQDYNPNLGVAATQASTINFISPASQRAGSPGFTLTVSGTGFVSGASVEWNGVKLPATFDSTTTNLTASIPATDLATPGMAQVAVSVPGQTQGNDLSNFVPFCVFDSTHPCSSSVSGASSSLSPAISANRRYVAFVSVSSDPATNASTGINKVFLRDTCTGAPAGCTPQTILVATGTGGADPNGESGQPAVSADGRLVVFRSEATNLVAGDTNGVADIFVRDTCIGAPAGCAPATLRVSLTSSGDEANGASDSPSVSADGRFVAFSSTARNLVVDGSSAPTGAFLRDTCYGAGQGCMPSTTRIPISSTAAR